MASLPKLEYHLINAFTTTSPHSGNQAAVVIFPTSNDPRATDDKFLLTTAQDFGFSETAYLVPVDAERGRWGLRWFTVQVEVPICGHATLAAAKVVLSRYPELSEIKFETRFWGELAAKRRQGGHHDENSLEVTISLSTFSQPALDKLVQTRAQQLEEVAPLVSDLLKIPTEQVIGVGEFEYIHKSLVIELAPEVDLMAAKIGPKAVTSFSPGMTIITQTEPGASSAGKLRTKSRVLFLGDMEDPVTGAAHAFLTGYYLLTPASERLPAHVTDGCEVKDVALDARQMSERGGKLYCELREGAMVDISGTASDWGTGTLTSW